MKKLLFLFVAVVITLSVNAQDRKMSEIKSSELPKGVTDFLKQNMPGATITRAGKIEDKSELNYVAVVESKGVKHAYMFDKTGKFKGKGDHLFNNNGQSPVTKPPTTILTDPKNSPAPKPPVKTETLKQAPKVAPAGVSVPKK
ncbi:MAG: hypothetical protein WCK34_06425 [Bacteroidota bacterium]